LFTNQLICLYIFIAVYVAIILFNQYKSILALSGVAILVVLGIMPPIKLLYYINWNILVIFWGSFVAAQLFIQSKIPAYLAQIIIARFGNNPNSNYKKTRPILVLDYSLSLNIIIR